MALNKTRIAEIAAKIADGTATANDMLEMNDLLAGDKTVRSLKKNRRAESNARAEASRKYRAKALAEYDIVKTKRDKIVADATAEYNAAVSAIADKYGMEATFYRGRRS